MPENLTLAAFAFVTALINDALGGGYGTIFGPVLLLLGYTPSSFIPAILFSETISEYWSGAWHLKFKNVNTRTLLLTIIGSLAGIAVAVFVIGVVLSAAMTKLYISTFAVFLGLYVLFKSLGRTPHHQHETTTVPSPWKTSLLGFVCGFNKSSSGGGYGPISTSGYMLLGLPAPVAVGTTIVAKATACFISLIAWVGFGRVNWEITLPMSIGAFLGAPIAAWLNNYFKLRIKAPHHGRLVGFIMTLVGGYALFKQLW